MKCSYYFQLYNIIFNIYTSKYDIYRSFKTSVSYSKPLADSKFLSEEDLDFEEDEDEKKYEKVLDHIRLSNGPDRINNENFYAHKMEQLADNGKV